ncbi:atpH, partial [Symbiodinium pilosum]
ELRRAIKMPDLELESKVVRLGAVCSNTGTDASVPTVLKEEVELAIKKPGIESASKVAAVEACTKAGVDASELNFLKAAMQKRADGSKLVMEYDTCPALLGVLVMKTDEAVLDNSLSIRLERWRMKLLAPFA